MIRRIADFVLSVAQKCSRCKLGWGIDEAIAGRLKPEELVTRRWRLDQINEAYADMLTGDVARGVIVF